MSRQRRRHVPDPALAAVAGIVVALVLTWLHHPRIGMYAVAGTLAGAALLRLLLPPRLAGMLVVRNRVLDVLVLTTLAVVVAVIASVTVFPPPG